MFPATVPGRLASRLLEVGDTTILDTSFQHIKHSYTKRAKLLCGDWFETGLIFLKSGVVLFVLEGIQGIELVF